MARFSVVGLLLLIVAPVRAGLYYSGEQQAELPSQWRGFLLDHRALRMIGIAPANLPPTLLREQYQEAAAKLVALSKQRALTADEAADLGALHVRLGEPVKAVEVLRAAQRKFPEHFHVVANLGTAWQVQGNLEEAARVLRDAVALAPAVNKPFEEAHLKLVQSRQKDRTGLDDVFGVRYTAERTKLPANAAAIVQQLALWLPADGRLLWQLGEIANAHGDVRTAANILDGCVGEFAMGAAELRQHRKFFREAADEIAKLPDSEHEKFRGDLKTRSVRPLLRKLDRTLLPAVRPDGVNAVPWLVVAETSVGRGFKPKYHSYLDDLDGKQVSLTGFMYPVGTDMTDVSVFMLIEYPIGCWFCETPDPTGIVFVSLGKGKTTGLKKGIVKVEGTLKLNRDDPEQYLYTIQNATVGEPD
ncbi:MAG: DUF3299 domain-containing protein [Planctomycetes bacterium]|nr:DUF3299 domain-containing protein [Planctomycetota bacterium]